MPEQARERVSVAVAVLALTVAACAGGLAVGLSWRTPREPTPELDAARAEYERLSAEYKRLAGDYRREVSLLEASRREANSDLAERKLLAEVQATLAKQAAELDRREIKLLRERIALLERLLADARAKGYLPRVKLPPRGRRGSGRAGAPANVDVMAVEEAVPGGPGRPEFAPPPPDGGGGAEGGD